MNRNSVVFFSNKPENHTHLIEMLKNRCNLEFCEFESDSYRDINLNILNISAFILDEISNNKEAVGILSKLSEDDIFSEIPILFTSIDAMRGFKNLGFKCFAYDILPQPFDYEISVMRFLNICKLKQFKQQYATLTQIQNKQILNQANKLKEQTMKMQSLNYELIDLLIAAIESRDLGSGQHIKRIRYFTKALTNVVMNCCPEYNITKVDAEYIFYASSVHDIGKIAIPDAILLKRGRLTPDEYEIMKTHTTRGYELLGKLNNLNNQNTYFKYCQEICLNHHERWDGRGYPQGLKGDDIPISAQIVSICDCYDALTSDRPYKTALKHEDAVKLILSGGCGAFSPKIVNCFKKALDEFYRIKIEFENESL